MDQKLMQGMLLAAVLCLIFAVTMSWVDIAAYGEYRGVGAPTIPRAGAVTPTRTGAPAAQADLLQLAPARSVGYTSIEVSKLLAAPLVQSLIPDSSQIPDMIRWVQRAVIFSSPAQPQQQQARLYGAASTAGTTVDEMRQYLAGHGTGVTVDGLEAYSVQAPSGQQGNLLVAPVEDDLILMASDEPSLREIVGVYQGGAGADLSEVQQMAAPYAGDMIVSASLVTPHMLTPPAGQPVSPFTSAILESLAGAKAVASGLSLDRGISLRAVAQMANDADAERAAGELSSELNALKQQLTQPGQAQNPILMMFQPVLLPIVNSVTISADGTDVHASAQISEQDLQNIVNLVKQMMQMMQQQVQGGMAAPPGAGGGPSMGGGR